MIAAVLLIVLVGALAYHRAPVLAWTVVLAAWLAGLQFGLGCVVPVAVLPVFAVLLARLAVRVVLAATRHLAPT